MIIKRMELCFNSTLVQLKGVHVDNIRLVVPKFQFYLSSIKSV